MKLHLNILLFSGLLQMGCSVLGNIPGGGTGTGANVTITDNGTTVTMANGLVSIVVTKTSAEIDTINYTFNNGGGSQTLNLLSGGNGGSGGYLYWFQNGGTFIAGPFAESVVVSNGDYAEISLSYASPTNGIMDIHYSMLRGSPGFYTTGILTHRSQDGTTHIELRPNIYAGSIFNWMSVDAARNKLMEVTGGAWVGVRGAPVECYLWTNGIYAGQYEDKYKYSADLCTLPAWGWSSVGTGGKNIGIWNVTASPEYYPGGPLERSLMEHIGTTILNVFTGGYYGMSTDDNFKDGEGWSKVYGPYFYYFNNVTNTLTGTNQPAQALYNDALAQGAAEQTAWPYYWFTNVSYWPASQRGAVSGQIAIADSGNPNATASNLWVGVVQQPPSAVDTVYDFQQWCRPYEFWVKTDANGNFIIPNVIATNNYTLYAFGQGANGTFMSQNQTGGSPPLLFNLPSVPFSVTVTAGATNNLGTVIWTNSSRVGPTVFEIGFPDRTAAKFRHGDDYWVGDIGPSPTNPVPIWSKWLEYAFDFPSGVNYVVGQSRWTTDWNFIQPDTTDSQGNYYPSTSTITFNLSTNPPSGGLASLYLGLCSDFDAAVIVSVNGVNAASLSSLSASPNGSIPSTGYFASYGSSDSNIREGNNGAFTDERLTFNASALHAGPNTISISFRQTGVSTPPGYFADHLMYDYIRLELTGYVPPPPASVAAYPGNNCNLISWPATPGTTSYNIYSTTNSGSGYNLIASGVIGPVCGSGWNNATYLDTTAGNGTTCYYVVQSVNPGGSSTNSPESSGVTPDAGISTSAPAAPTGLSVSSVGHQSVTLNWAASPGANYYTIFRSTLANTGGGSSNTLSTIVLNNTNTTTSYTDTSPTDGSIYQFFVTATGPGGTSTNSNYAIGVPLPAPPASAPGFLAGHFVQVTNITLSWSAVSGAVGYIISRANSSGGPYTFLQSITETAYTDYGLTPGTYYYQVTAVNAAGVSQAASLTVIALPGTPASLSAIPGEAQVTLIWTPVPGVAGYYLYSGTSSGNETTLVTPAAYTGTSYTNTGLTDGTTYYYIVAATNAGGLGPNSHEASATPSATIAPPRALTWKGNNTANVWDVDGWTNWLIAGATTVFNMGDTATFDSIGTNSVAVNIPGYVQPALVIVSNLTTKSYTFSGVGAITGTNILIKTGPGALTISVTNTYTGGTMVSNGMVTFSFGPAMPPSGTISLYNTGAVTVVTASGLPDVQVNGTNAIIGNGASGTGIKTLDVEGVLNLFVSGSSKVFDLTGPITGPGTVTMANSSAMSIRFNGTSGDGSAIFNLGTLANFASVRNTATAIAMGGLAGGPAATLQGASSYPDSVTYTMGGASTNAEYDGVIVNGSYSGNPAVIIVKTGGNTQTLTNANTYSGGTTINGGTLLVNNLGGSGTGSGNVAVNSGGTLGGRGIISGAVTVYSGGVFAPGNPLGVLTVSNNLTLAAGSTNVFQVQHSPLTNNAAKISVKLTEGGTLCVTNIAVAALTNGDSFKLFSATNYAGSFAACVLPPLGPNLAWNTATLSSSGVISVVRLVSPAIGGTRIDLNHNLVFSGSGAPADWKYYVLSSTNMSLPLAQWTHIATNQTDGGGNFSVTNGVDPDLPETFLILQFQ